MWLVNKNIHCSWLTKTIVWCPGSSVHFRLAKLNLTLPCLMVWLKYWNFFCDSHCSLSIYVFIYFYFYLKCTQFRLLNIHILSAVFMALSRAILQTLKIFLPWLFLLKIVPNKVTAQLMHISVQIKTCFVTIWINFFFNWVSQLIK